MRQYWTTNNMLGPCCLCPLINSKGPNFVEAVIYLATSGTYAGEYVASCAVDNCGYLGEFLCVRLIVLDDLSWLWPILVPMEWFYTQSNLYIREYPMRGVMSFLYLKIILTYCLYSAFGEQVPTLVTHTSKGIPSQSVQQDLVPHRPLKRTYAIMGNSDFIWTIVCEYWQIVPDVTADGADEQQPFKRIAMNGEHNSSLLIARIDSLLGITGGEFQKLFVKCNMCGYTMTCHVFAAHDCKVINLTGDTDWESDLVWILVMFFGGLNRLWFYWQVEFEVEMNIK